VLPADVLVLHSGLGFLQDSDDLFFRKTLSLHGEFPVLLLYENSLSLWTVLLGGGQSERQVIGEERQHPGFDTLRHVNGVVSFVTFQTRAQARGRTSFDPTEPLLAFSVSCRPTSPAIALYFFRFITKILTERRDQTIPCHSKGSPI